jgi:hypothetical protein
MKCNKGDTYLTQYYFRSRGTSVKFLSSTSRPALRSTHPPTQWVPFFSQVKWTECEANHSPKASVKVKNAQS